MKQIKKGKNKKVQIMSVCHIVVDPALEGLMTTQLNRKATIKK